MICIDMNTVIDSMNSYLFYTYYGECCGVSGQTIPSRESLAARKTPFWGSDKSTAQRLGQNPERGNA